MQVEEGECRWGPNPCESAELDDCRQHGISQTAPLVSEVTFIWHAMSEGTPITGVAAEAPVHSQPTENHDVITTRTAVAHENLRYLFR